MKADSYVMEFKLSGVVVHCQTVHAVDFLVNWPGCFQISIYMHSQPGKDKLDYNKINGFSKDTFLQSIDS